MCLDFKYSIEEFVEQTLAEYTDWDGNPANRDFANALQNKTFYLLQLQKQCGSFLHPDFTKDFLVTLLQLEAFSIILKKIPLNSISQPNMDVASELALSFMQLFFGNNTDDKITFLENIGVGTFYRRRLVNICLSKLYSEQKNYKNAYETAKTAFQTFSHCGTAGNLFYKACNEYSRQKSSCVADIVEDFPSPEKLKDFFCIKPFTECSVTYTAGKEPQPGLVKILPCRSSFWLPYGRLVQDTNIENAETHWNSLQMQELRRSILDGDFSYCIKQRCSILCGRFMHKRAEMTDPFFVDIIKNKKTVLDCGPALITLGYDNTCNLYCESCRKDVKTAGKKQIEIFDKIGKHIVLPLITDAARTMRVCISGEVFASSHLLELIRSIPYKQYPNFRLIIMSNGEMIKEGWKHLGDGANHVFNVQLSLDSLKSSTYEKYRRGGNFKRFMAGLEFTAQLIEDKQIQTVSVCVTVRKDTIAELPAIYQYCIDHNFTTFIVNKFENWATFTPDEFAEENIWDKAHPQFEDLCEQMRICEEMSKTCAVLYAPVFFPYKTTYIPDSTTYFKQLQP